ncbi:MAG TPA: PIG-L family deacetylase [Chloroflexota bacterium]|jgi:LmbE family N-acetylglucosaminyl deacetylase|nr:PIG-L family deacetylase [Chloroflexota bacterium]
MRIIAFGAHPDDCDIKVGGTAALWVQQGHTVKFVSVTNGDAGHHEIGGVELARRRKAEATAAGQVIGITYDVLDIHDGELEPTLPNRRRIIEIIREFQPDLVLSPRPNDYHPDHRYTATLVQNAAYMVTVPNIAAHTPHLRTNPCICYVSDNFRRPYPFTPDIAVGIDEVIALKLDMLHRHVSQMYEWLPYNAQREDEVPSGDVERRRWLETRRTPAFKEVADRYRPLLVERYGPERGGTIQYSEAFELSEYGARPTPDRFGALFPVPH